MTQTQLNSPGPVPGASAPPPPEKFDAFPLSPMQESLWIIDQVAPDNTAYNLPEAWRLHGHLDLAALQQSLNTIARRHESLRTHFAVERGKPVQVIEPPGSFSLHLVDLANRSDRQTELQRWIDTEAQRPFDLCRGPLARATIFRLADNEHVLLLNLHHIISDEWSFSLLRREIAEFYEAALQNRAHRLPELPIQYADFSVWQRERAADGSLAEHLAFWQKQLGGPLPVLDLPADYSRPSQPSFRGATQFHSLPKRLLEELKTLSREQGATLFMTLLAGFHAFLHRYTRQTDIIVGSPFSGREQPETEGLIGFFVNTHGLRCDLGDDPTFVELLGRVREATFEAQQHQALPLDKIIEALQPTRDAGRHPLFQAVFGMQSGMAEPWSLAGLEVTRLDVDNGGAKFDWTVLAADTNNGLQLRSEYRTDLFNPGTVGRFVRHWQTLLEGIVARPNARISELPLLEAAEEHQLLAALNPTPMDSAPGLCLHEWFEQQVERTPNATAVQYEDGRLSYAQLNARANQLARAVRKLGVGPDAPVGLCLERSLDLVVACLAVLKAGGAYVPIDPGVPAARMQFMLRDTRAAVLVSQANLRSTVAAGCQGLDYEPRVLWIDADRETIGQEETTALDVVVRPEHAAYIIYTSGSTGQPKGVLVSHFNVVRLMQRTQDWFHFDARDVWTLFHSYTFDFSVWELWGALLYGGRLVIVPHLVSRSPGEFLDLLAREKVTVLNQTPSAFRQLIWAESSTASPARLSLRYVIFGGEALELQSLKPWFERHGDEQPLLVNMYGITETTVHVTYRPIRRADVQAGLASVIGVPIPDLRLYVLDQRLRPVPVGVPGELCVGGAGVARGYLNRPELTAERFVADPWSGVPGARLYRSGDLARYTTKGELEYLGRIDHQVKIRGFRVELGEIESALNRHPGIRESVIVADGEGADRRLVAYAVPVAGPPEVPALRQHLSQLLPEYMVPAIFVWLPALPLTGNGKVDRRALPCPGNTEALLAGPQVAPRNEAEKRIAGIWADVLGRKHIGVTDNFFHLGGHSLLATQVMARLTEAFNVELSVRLLFEHPTIAGLAEALASAQQDPSGRPMAISRRTQADRARELLAQLDELSEAEIEALLRQPEHQHISA